MYYYIHDIYGYIASSEPPSKNIEDYTEITKEEYLRQFLEIKKED